MSTEEIKSYRDLLVWQKGMLLVQQVYAMTQKFPNEERFGLAGQIRRAAVSIPSNIAEGYGRKSTQDYVRFLRMAIGSLYEVQTELEIAQNQGYLLNSDGEEIGKLAEELERMLVSMTVKIRKNRHKT